MKAHAIFLLSAACTLATAQQALPDPITHYKQGIVIGCKEQASAQRVSADRADKVCTCISNTLEREVSTSDWQQLVSLSAQKKVNEERQLMMKYVEKTLPCHAPS